MSVRSSNSTGRSVGGDFSIPWRLSNRCWWHSIDYIGSFGLATSVLAK